MPGRKPKILTFTLNANGCRICVSHKPNNDGYVIVRIGGKKESLHRYVFEEVHGPIPDGMQVMHKCDNPKCSEITHLELGTAAQNSFDAAAKGRRARKLTSEVVREIRSSLESSSILAERFGVTRATIGDVRKRASWKHVGAA